MEIIALVWFWFYLLKPRLQRIERALKLDYTLSSAKVQDELDEY